MGTQVISRPMGHLGQEWPRIDLSGRGASCVYKVDIGSTTTRSPLWSWSWASARSHCSRWASDFREAAGLPFVRPGGIADVLPVGPALCSQAQSLAGLISWPA